MNEVFCWFLWHFQGYNMNLESICVVVCDLFYLIFLQSHSFKFRPLRDMGFEVPWAGQNHFDVIFCQEKFIQSVHEVWKIYFNCQSAGVIVGSLHGTALRLEGRQWNFLRRIPLSLALWAVIISYRSYENGLTRSPPLFLNLVVGLVGYLFFCT